ncbi:MAG: hypothetical protein GQ535_12275 [Rhodobacteraceae bacterium]|nr:hypothetical protein [Paracoccaceae bacterium]
MGRKLTDAEKAGNAQKRAAKKAEDDAKKTGDKAAAEEEAKAKAEAEAEAKAKAGAEAEAGAKAKADSEAELKAKTDADAEDEVVSIKTKRGVKSRWRAGYQFGPEVREIPLGDLSEDQLVALEADPSLVVQLGE